MVTLIGLSVTHRIEEAEYYQLRLLLQGLKRLAVGFWLAIDLLLLTTLSCGAFSEVHFLPNRHAMSTFTLRYGSFSRYGL